uniref:Uncharacterized protein n=1 Tax=Oryza nivara TaxID=4536 RepID=A0A0E0G329_ORYNI
MTRAKRQAMISPMVHPITSLASPNDFAELYLLTVENLLVMMWLLDCSTADLLPVTHLINLI